MSSHPVREFVAGFATLGRGFAFWRERPGLMALGLVPAVIVAAVVVTAVVLLGVFLDPITQSLTAFASGWGGWRDLLRILLGVALVIATLFLAARTFTAVTLLVGTPFYDRIQAAADESRGSVPDGSAPGFWASVAATAVLVVQSVGASLLVLLVGLIPAVGAAIAAVVGFGPLAGTLALTFFSFGVLSKWAYEAIETIDNGPLEAMTAVGANKLQWIQFGVVPQVTAQFIGFVMYMFEINIRAAAILGFVGAGGIGVYLNRTLGMFRYDQTIVIILFTLAIVLAIDFVSSKIRGRLI